MVEGKAGGGVKLRTGRKAAGTGIEILVGALHDGW